MKNNWEGKMRKNCFEMKAVTTKDDGKIKPRHAKGKNAVRWSQYISHVRRRVVVGAEIEGAM